MLTIQKKPKYKVKPLESLFNGSFFIRPEEKGIYQKTATGVYYWGENSDGNLYVSEPWLPPSESVIQVKIEKAHFVINEL